MFIDTHGEVFDNRRMKMTFLNETDTDYWRYIGKKMTYTRSWNYCICLHFFFTSVYGSNGVVRFIQRNIKLKSPILMTNYFSVAIFNPEPNQRF